MRLISKEEPMEQKIDLNTYFIGYNDNVTMMLLDRYA